MLNGGVLQLHHPDGQVFRFDPGSLSFAFSVTGHPFDAERFEVFHVPDDLEQWAADVLGAVRLRVSASSVKEAKRLRGAIWSAAGAVIDGRAVPASHRSTLNAFAVQASLVPRLDPDGTQSWLPSAP